MATSVERSSHRGAFAPNCATAVRKRRQKPYMYKRFFMARGLLNR